MGSYFSGFAWRMDATYDGEVPPLDYTQEMFLLCHATSGIWMKECIKPWYANPNQQPRHKLAKTIEFIRQTPSLVLRITMEPACDDPPLSAIEPPWECTAYVNDRLRTRASLAKRYSTVDIHLSCDESENITLTQRGRPPMTSHPSTRQAPLWWWFDRPRSEKEYNFLVQAALTRHLKNLPSELISLVVSFSCLLFRPSRVSCG